MTTTAHDRSPATGREAARFFGGYAKHFAAGAFATPTASEIDAAMVHGGWHWWDTGVAAVSRQLTRDSTRTDFTGGKYLLPQGSRVITHIATVPGAVLPWGALDEFDWVFAYVEDTNLSTQLRAQGREIRAVRVSASSELIACWGRAGEHHTYPPIDTATLVQIPLVPPPLTARVRIAAEIKAIDAWCDDYPYYSDGSWDAVSLRGFNPADPKWGVKPAEMSKAWWAKNPHAVNFSRCAWTVLAYECPATVKFIKSVGWWGELERVRLLRMTGRDGKVGSLSRHTDITDRAAGTRDGKIVRFHIPIVTHPEVTMSAWNLAGDRHETHLPPWTMWYLDARKPHAVDNRSGVDRVHLVVDVKADSAARQAIISGRDFAAGARA